MRLAVLSESLPPAPTGQSMLIYRLLEGLDPEGYCLISTQEAAQNGSHGGYARSLPGRLHQVPEGFRLRRGYRFGLAKAREWVNFPLAVRDRARRIAALLERERCDALLAFTGDVTHLPAGMLACRKAGLPFFAYVVDHYSYREWHTPSASFWAKRFEPRLMKGAAGVLVLNEALRDDLRARFGVEAEVVYNSFDLSAYERAEVEAGAVGGEDKDDDEGVKIVFTGDIYEAHYDAFRNLIAAIGLVGRDDVKLHVYTSRTAEHLAKEGISGPVVLHRPVASSEMPRVQMEADVLFLPLAFDSPYPGVVRTSAPTKMGEYMAARRPVVVHAPPDSFLAGYFRRHECGVVVDRLDPALLAQAIRSVLEDEALRRRLAERAWEQARADFDINAARAKFWKFLNGGGRAAAARAPGV